MTAGPTSQALAARRPARRRGYLFTAMVLSALAQAGTARTRETVPAAEPSAECPCSRAPRWVLRDSDGIPVRATVEPRCGRGDVPVWQEHRCLPVDFGPTASFPCVRIIDHEGRFLNLQYDLATGLLEPCMRSGDWKIDFSELGFFVEDGCQGGAYTAVSISDFMGDDFTGTRRLVFVDDEIWYMSPSKCLEHIKAWTWTILPPEECILASENASGCAYQLVPQWVRELLPNPPYTLDVEYD